MSTKKYTYLGNAEIESIEKMYNLYLSDPEQMDESWARFFEGFEFAQKNASENNAALNDKEFKVLNLIYGYRQRGHLFTKSNPVRARRAYSPTLDIENYGLDQSDLEKVFYAGNEIGIGPATLNKIIDHLSATYCRTIGAEYLFIREPEMVNWLKTRMEKEQNMPIFSAEEKKHILFHLKMAVGFEKFIHKKFIGQKRFSLEGAESLIPALNAIMGKGSELGIEEFIIGMAHRGRLNVLANILQKPYQQIFEEFMGQVYDENEENFLGDVKYHLGFENTVAMDSGKKVKISLVPNPSHLETVSGVVEGLSRGKIVHKYAKDYTKLAPVLIHGDAAIASQGIVYEVAQMSQLKGYRTGGTIHLVINNQIGFTTDYTEARSSTYCTDIAKVTKSPVFHVNGDDPEALIYVIKLAVEYRQKFQTDVYIDLLCYRRYGHNEGDEPRFTQPGLYKAISTHPNVRDIYAEKLINEQIIDRDYIKNAEKEFADLLEDKLSLAKNMDSVPVVHFLEETNKGFIMPEMEDFAKVLKTGISKEKLIHITNVLNTLPEDREFIPKIHKLIESRKKLISDDTLDWALCELLAYGSLVDEGYPVRISGQDSIRGTFSHRHAGYYDEHKAKRYYPLKNVAPDQAEFTIYNSPLSEYGVMGYEYGYALSVPNGLTIWEAQFGDFYNVAQVIIDQYVSSAVEKWGLMNGLVLYLPHGYEGQGPEHSSARLERFLTLCANNNMQVMNLTTPANLFHALRRQTKRNFKVPLVIFTPKSLLRHPGCVSSMTELESGVFNEIIDDNVIDKDKVAQVVLCTGKIYYDLLNAKQERKAENVSIIRIEQLYPFPMSRFKEILAGYPSAKTITWAQEEPMNMGSWNYISTVLCEYNILPVARPYAASPAGGLLEQHNRRHKKIIDKVFRECDCELHEEYCGMRCQVRDNDSRRKKYGFI